MKVKNNEIRPIGFVTLELNENEIQTLIGVFEENCHLRQIPFNEIMGTRGDIYKQLIDLFTPSKEDK